MAKKHHVTMRGIPIDMASLAANNAKKPALGNASMNARGDLLGQGGIILKTQEQIEADWAAQKAKQELTAGKVADIKAPLNVVVAGDTNQKQLNVDDANFDPATTSYDPSKPASPTNIPPQGTKPAVQPVRRKIVDAD